MSGFFLLPWRYLTFHKGRTALLAACIALVSLLPFAVNLLVDRYSAELTDRAVRTPLVAGAPGSRYDLVLNALYFRGRVPNPTSMAEFERIADSGLAHALPVLSRQQVQEAPLVGVTPDYFDFRGLRAVQGTLPLLLGDCVLGARVAERTGLGPGGTLLSEPGNLYDLTMRYPLRMRVAGVLARADTPDDDAVFVDIKTAWVTEGIGHGHVDAAKQDESAVLQRKEDEVALNASIVEFAEITPENVDSFHFHAAPAELPLTAVLVVPYDERAQTQIKGRFSTEKGAQLLVPSEVVAEILGFVFQMKTFFDANVALVWTATVLFLTLVVLLSLRVRRREVETLRMIGCARGTVIRLLGTELAITLSIGLGVALVLALGIVSWVRV